MMTWQTLPMGMLAGIPESICYIRHNRDEIRGSGFNRGLGPNRCQDCLSMWSIADKHCGFVALPLRSKIDAHHLC